MTQRLDFHCPGDFGLRGRTITPGRISVGVVFLGLGVQSAEQDWDDFSGVDLKGKIAVLLDVRLPDDHPLKPRENRRLLYGRSRAAAAMGAAAVLTVIDRQRQSELESRAVPFDNPERARFPEDDPQPSSPTSSSLSQIEIRHETAAAILGYSREELNDCYENISRGRRIEARAVPGTRLEIALAADSRPGETHNVVAFLEGRDPDLKEEFVLFGSHHDGIGSREGRIFNGADDNISGVVAMFELAEALIIERPRRSVIFVWHTGEKGLRGAYHFLARSPVPVEKMSAELNMDMICRNDPASLYLIGSNKLSSELDATINAVNRKQIGLKLDYSFEDPAHPDRFFFRSDHYPYIRYGIPGVWFFCGTTEDYHQETDDADRVDYEKMERVTRLVYLTARAVGNRDGLLELDLHPRITQRGGHNMEIDWRQPIEAP